ncbi:MAG: hypothetical protein D6788_10075, partial [Planctomycetota bacterium]
MLLLAVGWWGASRLTSPDRVRAAAERYLQQFVSGPVSIGGARFSWNGTVRLDDVKIAPVPVEPAAPAKTPAARFERPVFSCRRLTLRYDRWALLRGKVRVLAIAAVQPVCSIVRDRATGATNLRGLFRAPPVSDGAETYPAVELREARVEVISREVQGDRIVDTLTVNVRAMPSEKKPHAYHIAWRERLEDGSATGHSLVDLRTGRFVNERGGLPWMSIEAVMLAVNARYDAAGAWCDLLGLGGRVRAVDYHVTDSGPSGGFRSATVELKNATLSIPFDEADRRLPPGERYLRFEAVVGTAQLKPDGLYADFHGRFHGSPCRVHAVFRGGSNGLTTLDDAAVEAEVRVESLTLPRPDPDRPPSERRFVNRWHRLASLYNDYDPSGLVDIEIDVTKKAGPQEPVRVRRAVLTARGGEASCRFFPYRAEVVTGVVEWTPDGVRVRDLIARHGGGTIRIEADIDRPSREAEKRIHIKGTEIPIDDALVAALPPRLRRVREWVDARGRLDVVLDLHQPEIPRGAPMQWEPRATLTLSGVEEAMYVGFPYPIRRPRGTVRTDGHRFELIEVQGTGAGGEVTVDGEVVLGDGGVRSADVRVCAERVSLEPELIRALPLTIREATERFAPQGVVDAAVRLDLPHRGRPLDYEADILLRGVSVRFDAVPLEVGDLAGHLRITPGRLEMENVRGRYEGAPVTIEGWASGDEALDVTVRTENLPLDAEVRALLPDTARNVLSSWRLDGPIRTRTRATRRPGGNLSLRTEVFLRGARLAHPKLPAPVEGLTGTVVLEGETLTAKGISARYGGASLQLDLSASLSASKPRLEMNLAARELHLDESVQRLLPATIRSAWERLRPDGQVNVLVDHLVYGRDEETDRPVWKLVGYVELHDVTLMASPAFAHLWGTIRGGGKLPVGHGDVSLDGTVFLERMSLLDLPIE